MRILYLGDIMGKPGRHVVEKLLLQIRTEQKIDFVIAQSENVTHGRGLSDRHFFELREVGVDAFTGGNHTFERKDTMRLVADGEMPVVAPANIKGDTFGNYKIVNSKSGKIAVFSIQGFTVPKGYDDEIENPLKVVDELLVEIEKHKPAAIVMNIHSEFSSEKVMMGHYLDGKVTVVVGDHWHTPTADCRVLPKNTAHITDVGMCGTLNSSLGVDVDVAIKRWQGESVKNVITEEGPWQLNGVIVDTDSKGLAKSAQQIIQYVEAL